MKRYIFPLLFISLLLISFLINIFPSKVFAADLLSTAPLVSNTTFTWVNQATIDASVPTSSGGTFPIDFNATGSPIDAYQNTEEQFTTTASTCQPSAIWANPVQPNLRITQGTIYFQETANGPCYGYNFTSGTTIRSIPSGSPGYPGYNGIPSNAIGSPDNSQIAYEFTGSDTIERIDNDSNYTFTHSSGDPATNYERGDRSTCADTIVIGATQDGGTNTQATLWELTGSTGTDFNGCQVNTGQDDDINGINDSSEHKQKGNGSFTIVIAGTPAAPVANAGGGSSSTGASSPTLQCSGSIINPLTWFVCPLIAAAQGFVGDLDSAINDLLNVDVSNYMDQNTSANAVSFYKAWDVMRLFAMAIIVILALIMIISQAIGVEALSVYTVRKALPRLLIAIIAITLSWDILKFLIQLTDDLGHDIGDIIYAPFTYNGQPAATAINTGGLSGLNIVEAGGLLVLGIIGALSFVGTAAVAVLVAFVFLVLRKILILALIIFAPVAIACAILPNTQKVWKFWSDNFMRALIMFPLIAGFIAVGRVFAIISGNAQSNGLEQDLIKLVAWFGPYFMIPMTFKMAGGLMGQIGGIASQAQSLGSKPFSAFRTNRAKDRYHRATHGGIWDPKNRRGRIGNRLASWAMEPQTRVAVLGRNVPGLSGVGRKKFAQVTDAQVDQTAKLQEELNNKWHYNDKAYRALTGAHEGFNDDERSHVRNAEGKVIDARSTQKRLKDAKLYGKSAGQMKYDDIMKMADILDQGTDTERNGARALRSSAGRIVNLHADPEMGYASLQGAGLMGMASHGFATAHDLAAVTQEMSEGGRGSSEFAANVGARASLLGQRQNPTNKNTYGLLWDQKHGFYGAFDKEDLVENGQVQYEKDEKGNDKLDYRGNKIARKGDYINYGRARDLVRSVKVSDWAGAKSGSIHDAADVITRVANESDPKTGQLTFEAQGMRSAISQGVSHYNHLDPDSTREWSQIAKAVGLEVPDYTKSNLPTAAENEHEAANQGGHDPGNEGFAGRGAPPSGGGVNAPHV